MKNTIEFAKFYVIYLLNYFVFENLLFFLKF